MNRPIRRLLWDLDGTLATWKDLRIIFSVTRCYLPHLFSLGHPLKVALAATRAYIRMLRTTDEKKNWSTESTENTDKKKNRSTESTANTDAKKNRSAESTANTDEKKNRSTESTENTDKKKNRSAESTEATEKKKNRNTENGKWNAGAETNNALFNRILGTSLHVPPDEIARLTRIFLADPNLAKAVSGSIVAIPEALDLVNEIAGTGLFEQNVATNPVMPSAFNRQRLAHAGYDTTVFTHISGSEFFSRQKKYPRYYVELLSILGARPEECLMIGNDLEKDLVAKALGIPFFLLENCHTRRKNPFPGYSPDWTGDYALLRDLILGNQT